jgi:hypothetical protein
MDSVKYYDRDRAIWVREYADGHRQQSTPPTARFAAPGMPASGLVRHRDTQNLLSPIATPHGSWVAQTPSGQMRVLNRAEYISLRTPRIPQPAISHRLDGAIEQHQSFQRRDEHRNDGSWLLTSPVVLAPVGRQQPPRHSPPPITVAHEPNTSRRRHELTRRELVPDPLRPGQFATRRALRERDDLVEDPRQPGHYITRQALQLRGSVVVDPRNPERTITVRALRQRDDVVPDPQRPGHFIRRETLHRRADLVDDPERPGHTITRYGLRQRERRHR